MVRPMTKNRANFALSEATVKNALQELIRSFGYDPHLVTTDQLQDVADKLSRVSGRDRAWGWRYLRNVLNGNMEASRDLTRAIMTLGATLDDVPLIWAQAKQVQLSVIGNVRTGALVKRDSRDCLVCQRPFIPTVWNDYYCSAEHREQARQAKKAKHD